MLPIKVSCQQCGQRVALDEGAIESLRGQVDFECPSCEARIPLETVADSLDGLKAEQLLMRGLQTPQPLGEEWEAIEPSALNEVFEGRYQISKLLGRGGMGAVYRGVDARLERGVAIKLLPVEVADRPEARARFEREAKALASLDHPNIVNVYDYGTTADGCAYFVMEFVDGMDLRQMRQRGQLTVRSALELISQVCSALQYAHGRGIIHRDIKPANILVTRQSIAKVADFGLAKATGTETQAGQDLSLTLSGMVVGTPAYMAPEQREGSAIDHRADIFALGIMLYEFLTGTPPQGAWTPPSRKAPLDVRLDAIAFRALQENPSERYQSAGLIKMDLDAVISSSGGEPLPAGTYVQPLPSGCTGGPSSRVAGAIALPVQAHPMELNAFDPHHELILETTTGVNRTLLVLGTITLLVFGVLAVSLALRKTGDTYNSEETTSSEETHNTYFGQTSLQAPAGIGPREAVAELHTIGDQIIGLTRQDCTWAEAQKIAQASGATILAVEDHATGWDSVREWLATSHVSVPTALVWIRQQENARLFDGSRILPVDSLEGRRKAVLQWPPPAKKRGAGELEINAIPPDKLVSVAPAHRSAATPAVTAPQQTPAVVQAPPGVDQPTVGWTMKDGRVIQARFVRLNGEAVIIAMNGQQYSVAFANLSPLSITQAKMLGKQAP